MKLRHLTLATGLSLILSGITPAAGANGTTTWHEHHCHRDGVYLDRTGAADRTNAREACHDHASEHRHRARHPNPFDADRRHCHEDTWMTEANPRREDESRMVRTCHWHLRRHRHRALHDTAVPTTYYDVHHAREASPNIFDLLVGFDGTDSARPTEPKRKRQPEADTEIRWDTDRKPTRAEARLIALEEGVGAKVEFEDARGAGTIRVTQTGKDQSGNACRRYQVSVTNRPTTERIACQTRQRDWRDR